MKVKVTWSLFLPHQFGLNISAWDVHWFQVYTKFIKKSGTDSEFLDEDGGLQITARLKDDDMHVNFHSMYLKDL